LRALQADENPAQSGNFVSSIRLKEVALACEETPHTVVLLSHALTVPAELKRFMARFDLSLPDSAHLREIVNEETVIWAEKHPGRRVTADRTTLDLLIRNLSGMSAADARRLVRKAIYDDGAITRSDLSLVTRAKYDMLDMEGVLSFEYETGQLGDVGGVDTLKEWLSQRRAVFHREEKARGLEPPKGILLLGVQGGGKSLAAKSVAGMWGVPLLRLDFGALYNKFFGESERNLRQALRIAQVMAPCVLWLDEIEKGISSDEHDGGTSRRVLGTLLTWMAERKHTVFMVATANDISALPPELLRKGRLDEIFFVDLPERRVRAEIFSIHLHKRDLDPDAFDLDRLAEASEGYSGAEIEQVVVAALYSAVARDTGPQTVDLLREMERTRALSVVMAEKVAALRAWASGRTVPAG
jgi:SpoVK/Ycf46/Vps4 family AAA+-type ATPase